ncbi:S-adenosyl-L-methionine-dependent methyltransferase [Chlamydoabsidia padenii]|nr:S-adenosyl-L-methionine-dependent methyltransferase [Chlamydoabsidia padenii]
MEAARQPPPRRQSISDYFNNNKRRQQVYDYKEVDRWQRQHYLLKSARKTNTWATFNHNDGAVIVDVGTGNGIWAMEMANQYPAVQVVGLDLLDQQQNGPSNLRFCQCDVVGEPWPMDDNTVDFIFQRSMNNSVKKVEWSTLLMEMYRVLKPGGSIELVEPDFWRHNPGPVQQALDSFIQEQCHLNGLDFYLTNAMDGLIKDAGFNLVDKRTMDIPLGEWPTDQELKQFGFINKEAQKALLKNNRDIYIKEWGLSGTDFDLAVQEVLVEFDEHHSFTRFHCWVVQKPAVE